MATRQPTKEKPMKCIIITLAAALAATFVALTVTLDTAREHDRQYKPS